jgi:hypothetical protein
MGASDAGEHMASPTIENSNRMLGWLKRMQGLREGLSAAA